MSDTGSRVGWDEDLDAALRAWGLRQRAASTPAPAPLAPLPQPRGGRGRLVPALAAVVVVAVVVGAVVAVRGLRTAQPAPLAAPVPVVAVAQVRQHLSQAALTRPLALDDGTLRLDPPTSPRSATSAASVDEARALALWRSGSSGSGGNGSMWITGVVIARADITLTLPVLDRQPLPLRPARPATFTHRTGWVIFSDPGQASCPAHPLSPAAPGAAGTPPALSVWLLSADGTDAVDYTSAGLGICGFPEPAPRAWASGITTTTRPAGQNRGRLTCSSTSNTVDGVTYAFTLLAPGPCTGGGLDPQLQLGPLFVSIVTDPGGPFTYYDGDTHRSP